MTVEEWDREWQDIYDQGRARSMTPNAAVWRAYREMDRRGHGERPSGPVEAHREQVGVRSVVVHGGPVTSIPNRADRVLEEVPYERGSQAKETNE